MYVYILLLCTRAVLFTKELTLFSCKGTFVHIFLRLSAPAVSKYLHKAVKQPYAFTCVCLRLSCHVFRSVRIGVLLYPCPFCFCLLWRVGELSGITCVVCALVHAYALACLFTGCMRCCCCIPGITCACLFRLSFRDVCVCVCVP